MQGGKNYAEDDEGHDEAVDQMRPFVEFETFKDHRRKLDGKHGQIGHHADADLKQHRSVIPMDHHVPDAERLSEVNKKRDRDHDVAKESSEHGRTEERFKLLDAEDINRASHEKTTTADDNARE